MVCIFICPPPVWDGVCRTDLTVSWHPAVPCHAAACPGQAPGRRTLFRQRLIIIWLFKLCSYSSVPSQFPAPSACLSCITTAPNTHAGAPLIFFLLLLQEPLREPCNPSSITIPCLICQMHFLHAVHLTADKYFMAKLKPLIIHIPRMRQILCVLKDILCR